MSTITPKVFISYSLKSYSNKIKVDNFTNRLAADTANVILDKWDLNVGLEKHQFMEQMVNNPDVKRIQLIYDEHYHEMANNKVDGLGIKSLIV